MIAMLAQPTPVFMPIEKQRERLLTADEVADWLGMSKQWVSEHSGPKASKPVIPAVILGEGRNKKRRFRSVDIEAFIAKNVSGGASKQ